MWNHANSPWTAELKERVKDLWKNNSAADIAGKLNSEGYPFTRNSVIGVLHRMGVFREPPSPPIKRDPPEPRIKRSSANHVRRPLFLLSKFSCAALKSNRATYR